MSNWAATFASGSTAAISEKIKGMLLSVCTLFYRVKLLCGGITKAIFHLFKCQLSTADQPIQSLMKYKLAKKQKESNENPISRVIMWTLMLACTAAVLKDRGDWHDFLLPSLVGWAGRSWAVCWFIRTSVSMCERVREWGRRSQWQRIWVTSCFEWEDSAQGRVIFDKLCALVMKRKVVLGTTSWLTVLCCYFVCVRVRLCLQEDDGWQQHTHT